MKKYKFFYHYNKPESKKRGYPVITIHYRKQCIMVRNLICKTMTYGKINKRQPFFVIAGKALSVNIENEIAVIE